MRCFLKQKTLFLSGAFLLCCFYGAMETAHSDPLEEVISVTEQANQEAENSQERIDGLDDEAKRLLEEYRSLIRRADSLSTYNTQLKRIIGSQHKEKKALLKQFDDLLIIHQEIEPVMQRMVEALERFISLDIPFFEKERSHRIERLQKIMAQSSLPVSERFRNIIDAYKIEAEYGHTVDAYRDELLLNGEVRRVEFLKVGRIALYYQTADGNKTGCWDAKRREWTSLPPNLNRPISKALKIARKQAAPALLELALKTPEVAE